jgi:hypothetical protein
MKSSSCSATTPGQRQPLGRGHLLHAGGGVGLALFHPALFWLTALFGGGWTRILHPYMGW